MGAAGRPGYKVSGYSSYVCIGLGGGGVVTKWRNHTKTSGNFWLRPALEKGCTCMCNTHHKVEVGSGDS